MSSPHDALLQACLLAPKLKLMEKTRQGALAARLLDLAVLCSRLACDHADASALTAVQQIQQIQTNARDVFAVYTRVTGAFHSVISPNTARELPPWDAPANSADPSLPPVHLSSAAMQDLVNTLVPLLHIPVEKSLLSTIIQSLHEPLADALRATMMDQMEEDLLERLTGPLFDQLLPRIRDKISNRLGQEATASATPGAVVTPDLSPQVPCVAVSSIPASSPGLAYAPRPALSPPRTAPVSVPRPHGRNLVRRTPRASTTISASPYPASSPSPTRAQSPSPPPSVLSPPPCGSCSPQSQVSHASPASPSAAPYDLSPDAFPDAVLSPETPFSPRKRESHTPPPSQRVGASTPPPSQRVGASDYMAYIEPSPEKSLPELQCTTSLGPVPVASSGPSLKKRRMSHERA
ncbi:hypothetical protein VTO73DRAFT_11836 [Trametes versicolor]